MTFQTMMNRSPLNDKHDFFSTPPLTTLCLLSQVLFYEKVWEPACGDGAISKLLWKLGYNVFSTDIKNYGYEYQHDDDTDFLNIYWTTKKHDIVTNPPYNIHLKWIEKSLEHARKKVALLFPLVYLTPKNKRDFITNVCGFQLIVPGWRSQFIMPGKTHYGGMKDYAWFVWDKEKPATKTFEVTIVEKADVEQFAVEEDIDLCP